MIGNQIKQLRKEKKITLSNLADRAGISKSYLSYIERGLQKNPSIQVLEKIADVLEVDVNSLLHYHSELNGNIETGKEWLEILNDAMNSGMTKNEIKDLKNYIEYLKWRSQKGD